MIVRPEDSILVYNSYDPPLLDVFEAMSKCEPLSLLSSLGAIMGNDTSGGPGVVSNPQEYHEVLEYLQKNSKKVLEKARNVLESSKVV
jgi:hypothetical protein